MTPSTRRKTTVASGLVLAMAALVLGVLTACKGPGLDVIGALQKKIELISRMRVDMLKSVEAEKSAVMADTDEASRTFAGISREKAKEVEGELGELAPLIEKDHTEEELARFREFGDCWREWKKVDEVILDFAVQNTNIKAANLSFTKGMEAAGLFEKDLRAVIGQSSPSEQCGEIAALASGALAAGLEIQALLAPHIITEDDREMDRIEGQIEKYRAEVTDALKGLAGIVPESAKGFLAQAGSAFEEHSSITLKVIRLSRQNSNVKSFRLSLGRKRVIAAKCDDILASLHEAVSSRAFKATR